MIKGGIRMTVGTTNKEARDAWVGKKLSALKAGLRILDAGAGEQSYRKFCSHLRYVSQDFGQYDGAGDGKGLQMGSWDTAALDIVSDITAVPEPDSSFDAVLCTEVFEHLTEPVKAIKEFSRLLRKDGTLILTSPFCSLTHFAPYHFYSGFNRYFYERHLEANGFEIIEIEPNGNFFEYIGQEMARVPSVAEKYAKSGPGRMETMALNHVLKMLERMSKDDAGSSELLCFGYHVLSRKK